jgi:hypothetical protein
MLLKAGKGRVEACDIVEEDSRNESSKQACKIGSRYSRDKETILNVGEQGPASFAASPVA